MPDIAIDLSALYRQTVQSLSGRELVRRALQNTPIPALRVRLFGLGKASASMAQGALDALRAEASGFVAAHEPLPLPLPIEFRLGAHPLPDETSARAAQGLLDAVGSAEPEDAALFLISGGGSSIAMLPAADLSIGDCAATVDALLKSGASIDDVNVVRKHLSRVGGGQLAARCPARKALALFLSDVPSSALSTLASGPTLPDPSTFGDALDVLQRHRVEVPAPILSFLERGARGEVPETPKPGDPRLRHLQNRVLASPDALARKAAELAWQRGLSCHFWSPAFDGDLEVLFELLCHRIRTTRVEQPLILALSGEPRLRVPPSAGRGGRMQHLALKLAVALEGQPFRALCAGSDGRDGPSEHAGAVVDGATALEARRKGIDLAARLAAFDAESAVRELGLGLPRFASGTNLTDLILVLHLPPRSLQPSAEGPLAVFL